MPPEDSNHCQNLGSTRTAGLQSSESRFLRDEARRGTRCQSMGQGRLQSGASRWTWPPRTSGAEPSRRPLVLASNSQDIRGFRGVSQPVSQAVQTLRRQDTEHRSLPSCQRTTDTACGTAQKRQNCEAPLGSQQACAEGTFDKPTLPCGCCSQKQLQVFCWDNIPHPAAPDLELSFQSFAVLRS